MKKHLLQIMRQISNSSQAGCKDMGKTYEEAVHALNTLQSNAAVLEKARVERQRNKHLNVPVTMAFAERCGIKGSDLDALSVIHVSGTKGKGSTCAFTESILRNSGYKTGFYSSPHLVEVRERIRINGRPLSREAFSSYFWECYEKLQNSPKASGDALDMPPYFKFLTLMAFHVFLQEKVDVAIIEVGIGGQYDCTNILRSPVVCGVTSLGIDHTAILGDSLDQIAWNKAGIFKSGVPAVTVQQPENSLQVLESRAVELGALLSLAPTLSSYDWGDRQINLGIHGDMQKINASLALQLCNTWIQDHGLDISQRRAKNAAVHAIAVPNAEFNLTPAMYAGLTNCRWPGRNQTIRHGNVTYYLDGAHTVRSVDQCVSWFNKVSAQEEQAVSGPVRRVILFNTTGDRSSSDLLSILHKARFDAAVFCPNIAQATTSESADQTNHTVTLSSQQNRCVKHKNIWLDLSPPTTHSNSAANHTSASIGEPRDIKRCRLDSGGESESSLETDSVDSRSQTSSDCEGFESSVDENSNNGHSNKKHSISSCAEVFDSVEDSLRWATSGKDACFSVQKDASPGVFSDAGHIQVLCTGSLHLIGAVIHVIEPNFNDQ